MIVITGAAGSIGSVFLGLLNEQQLRDAVLIDDFAQPTQYNNLAWKHYSEIVSTDEMEVYLSANKGQIDAIVHLGNREDLAIDDRVERIQEEREMHQYLWFFCSQNEIPFIYSSTAEVYKNSTIGNKDDAETSFKLEPNHLYVKAKLALDNWSLRQESQPPFWASLRITNVYGPNEYHKNEQASIVLKAYNEILANQFMVLHDTRENQSTSLLKDYIYIMDVAKIIWFLIDQQPNSGIYNIGSATNIKAEEVCDIIFDALGIEKKYQYHPFEKEGRQEVSQSDSINTSKLREAGYTQKMTSIEDGVKQYVNRFLKRGEFY